MLKVRRAVFSLGFITLVYVALLVWIDSRSSLFAHIPDLISVLPTLILLSFCSYLLRYLRWHWLLFRAGFVVSPFLGLLAYLAGFAFTATPGKVGELLRIRYLEPVGIPPYRVIACFVYERAFDLLAVLAIASLVASGFEVFPEAAFFVLVLVSAVGIAAKNPRLMLSVAVNFRRRGFGRLSRLIRTLGKGITGATYWMNPFDACISFLLGFIAWGLTSAAFVLLLGQLGINIPVVLAFSIYPVAMLAGAASMVPGGLASTEMTIVALLLVLDVPFVQASVAAIGIRVGTLWISILVGMSASLILEFAPGVPYPRSSLKFKQR